MENGTMENESVTSDFTNLRKMKQWTWNKKYRKGNKVHETLELGTGTY